MNTKAIKFGALGVLAVAISGCATSQRSTEPLAEEQTMEPAMELGAFSVSLAVKDLQASRAFYEKLGFSQVGGEPAQNWLILRNGTTTIGLFQGMFEKNILTFNPGWSALGEDLESFTDVRDIERMLRERGLEPVEGAAAGDGPAHVVLEDPDGNPVLIDQHVGRRE
jgi:catechol 2,3-dioxygenase-like lactoylglutathione lyase family enzyme